MEHLILISRKIKEPAWYIPAILIVFFILLATLTDRQSAHREKPEAQQSTEALDTFIPDGFVLVPIEVQNLESLDSLIGQYGVVDLYVPGEKEPLGRGLKLVRSPQNPTQMAVLVSEENSRRIVGASDKPFQVVVQNPSKVKSEFQKNPETNRIVWED